MEIQIKYIRGVEEIEKIKQGDWIDLRCAEDIELKKGEFMLIPLGVIMRLPDGYEAIVAPRSSTFKKYGLIMTNSIGVIDEEYSGEADEWRFPAYATRDIRIEKNTRICQFRIIEHQPMIEFKKVDAMDKVSRGGFGSTGEK